MSAPASPALRRAWLAAQGLAAPAPRPVEQVLAETGWARTLGGADGYLSLAARCPGLTVGAVAGALAEGRIEVVPALRGCMYLVPAAHVPLARALARGLSERRGDREREKAGMDRAELDRVCAAVQDALAAGPATVHALKKRLPEGIVRSLGPAGKKLGLSSSLTPALRQMELDGRLARRVVDDRLDHERYLYVAGSPAPAAPDPGAAAAVVGLALRWLAPTTVGRLAAFTGLTKTACKKALAAMPGAALDHQIEGEPAFAPPDAPPAPARVGVVLLPGLDNLLAWQGPAAFVAPADLDRSVHRWGMGRTETWATVKHVLTRTILVDGEVVGAWEWDPAAGRVVTGLYDRSLAPEDAQALAAAVADRDRLLGALGHGSAFSLDKEARVQARADEVRALGA